MSDAVIFRNPGLIDPRCITTLGVNVKPGSKSPIGYFGTGLKYAIAVLLREGQSITIWRGTEAIRFAVDQVDIRGKAFGMISMNGRELGFTTELGKNWKVWQAYRELHCNAADEDGATLLAHAECAEEFAGRDSETWIVCTGDKILQAHTERADFLLLDTPGITLPGLEIRERPSKSIFYRGVAVSSPERPSALTYNLLLATDLTEDRTASCPWLLPFTIGQALQASTDRALLTRILSASPKTFEGTLKFSGSAETSDEFLEVAAEQFEINMTGVNPSALEVLKSKRGLLAEKIREFSPDDIERSQLSTAADFATAIGFQVRDYPIILAERIGAGVMGLSHDGKIYLTKRAFEGGTKQIAATLIEEFVHLREGFRDETRALQDHFLMRLVSLGERVVGRAL